ncbi:uncharacterized protein LOC121382736 isoform X2 [Gigantopelta aegis]|uniref:uncharacterized protein LOC121382736 isoform X1 n=1 Tax=Gigantopelta aegis TaxID=1735272 RepID=UPI001B887D07|nr:uncharacterized protein LOC121382736 isoform X1 [Gigantopelta aegis]XP_041368235.1 uncharacterized protein LOC121382736 isoform X2 [Gigantopelta aegis]
MSGDETTTRPENSYRSTNDDENVPPLSFADLGIPTGPQLETTVLGKYRKIQDVELKEFVFLGVTCVSLIATAIFTIYKLATVSKSDTDFTFALVLLLNTFFCLYYIIHGILNERPYEIFILVVATFFILLYIILNYAIGKKGTVKLVRLIAACVLCPIIIGLGGWIGKEYLLSGHLVFRIIGANSKFQTMCKMILLTFDLLTLDLQLGASMVILILSTGMKVDTKDIVILIVGGIITIAWFVLGMWTMRKEHKIGTYVFLAASPLEIGYIIYKVVKSIENIAVSASLASSTIACGVLALTVRVAVIIFAVLVMRNYNKGLKEKAFE